MAMYQPGEATFGPGSRREPLDQVDVVLAEWTSGRPGAEFDPIAFTARISRLAQILQQRIERTCSRFGLDWGQFLALTALRGAGAPYRMSPRELHRLLRLSPAAVTNRLYRLEAKGLIERGADPADQRSLPVVLTPLGLSTVERAMAACLEAERGLLTSAPGDDMASTVRCVRRLLAAYEDYPSRRSQTMALARTMEAYAPELAEAMERGEPATNLAAADPIDHPTWWPESHRELERLQRRLARRVDEMEPWRWTGAGSPTIGGVFVSLPSGQGDDLGDPAWAAAIVMHGGDVIATATATRLVSRPYESGYLALSIGPILDDVIHALAEKPDIIVVNAAGRDHQRGAGLAIQLGAALDVPTIGVTERPVVGSAPEAGPRRGDWTPVRVDDRLVGFRVRTMSRAKSITVHAAWRTTPEVARDIVLRSTGSTRLPEPIQRARQVSRRLRSQHARATGSGLQDGIHG